MGLNLYNTRYRRKVPFVPIEPGSVKMYTCGPTVYNDAHIGNFRTYVFEDLLRRVLKYLGFRVTQVMNITDVDDKTIRQSRLLGVPLSEYTAPIIKRFFADVDALNIERAEHYVAATDHVPDMIVLVQTLLDKGFAYQADGSVYFSIEKYPEYGRLSGMNLEKMARGVRIDADEYDKDDFRDFALWRGWTEADGEVCWDAPFGRGRPGWHIECSAMSMRYLGEEFDIHTGGVDNIFPHHENEIAQSVCATGKRFVNYWLHSAHLITEGEKMSKSLGNFITLRELIKRGNSPRSIRYVLLTTHYRQQVIFSATAVEAATASLERLDTLRNLAEDACERAGDTPPRPELTAEIELARRKFTAALSDDLGIAGAMAALFDMVASLHRLSRAIPLTATEGLPVLGFWREIDTVLGFLFPERRELDARIREMVRRRVEARRDRRFTAADQIRAELAQAGFTIEDTPEGTVVAWEDGRELVS